MSIENSPLGQATVYPDQYDPSVLFPIARAVNRGALFQGDRLPFSGVDIWNAYELSWLDPRGKPQVAMATIRVPAASPNIIESKSFKLYLNSFNQTRLDSADDLLSRLERDLSEAAQDTVSVTLAMPAEFGRVSMAELAGVSIDGQDLTITHYEPAPELLALVGNGERIKETLYSNLLKSNCPVTGQPDWGSVQISYSGPRIDRAGLLAYIVSFRQHAEFHEHCVERMFTDILAACGCEELTVYARYTRRGGLDINPWRTNTTQAAPSEARSARQ